MREQRCSRLPLAENCGTGWQTTADCQSASGLTTRCRLTTCPTIELEFDYDCLYLGVLLQSVLAQFASDSGLLEPAEWSPWVQNVIAVHPHRAGPHAIG